MAAESSNSPITETSTTVEFPRLIDLNITATEASTYLSPETNTAAQSTTDPNIATAEYFTSPTLIVSLIVL